MKHKLLGQVYTPEWIVKEILNLVGYSEERILKKFIIEPSCGDGAFLIEIVMRYISVAKSRKIAVEEIISDLETYIYGVEIDNIEYDKCITRLNTLTQEELNTSDVKWKIFNQNTLEFYKSYISFFDFVVGNPPYIRIHNLDIDTRIALKNDFLFAEGTTDIYLSFFELSIRMLKDKAFLGFITPNSYLHNSSYKLFREFLQKNKLVNTLIDFKSNKLFNGFSTYTAISVFQNGNTNDFFLYKELINDEIVSVNNVFYHSLNNKDWSFSNNENENFLKSLQDGKNSAVKDFFDVQYGFATLRDKIFIANVTNHEDTELVWFNNSPIEKKY